MCYSSITFWQIYKYNPITQDKQCHLCMQQDYYQSISTIYAENIVETVYISDKQQDCSRYFRSQSWGKGSRKVFLLLWKLIILFLFTFLRVYIQGIMKRQALGIARNKVDRLIAIKKDAQRKKNRFQMVGKDDDQDSHLMSLTTTNSDPLSNSQLLLEDHTFRAADLYKQARNHLRKAADHQKKIAELAKMRLSSLREKENEKYDENITKLADQATKSLFSAEAILKEISKLEWTSPTQHRVNKNLENSLASELQEASRSLRSQQQEYFRKVKSYEGSNFNSAIQLTMQQRKAVESQWAEMGWEQEVISQKKEENTKIGELVGSISKLSALYKQLGQMVVAQGTVIDRIDYNLQQTEQHVSKAVVHLVGANQAASSPFAAKIIKSLFVTIVIFALILAVKYMK